MNVIVVELK